VAAGRFRADLFYRLRVIPIALPPLRERREDIAPLCKHFVAHFNREFSKRVRDISPAAQAMLAAYRWPGNVRELRNVIERAVLLADGEIIGTRELPPEVAAPMAQPAGAATLPADGVKLDDVERRLLVEALERAHGNQSGAAALLGISRHQVRTRMKRHGLLAAALLAMSLVAGPLAGQQRGGAALACLRCHGSREFLERAVPAGRFRPSLVIAPASGEGAAHASLSCVSCHAGAVRFPHGVEAATPVACASCHAAADSAWSTGVHGRATGGATCTGCHGVHDVRQTAWLRTRGGKAAMGRACTQCHPSQAASAQDVHGRVAACTDCHGGHDIRPVRDPATHGVSVGMARRCSACHQREAAEYWADVHGTLAARDAASPSALGRDTSAVAPGGGSGRAGGAKDSVGSRSAPSSATCVDCHWGHAVRDPRNRAAHFALADACIRCHRAYGATFRENYHGQATKLGSTRAALCADCHTAHTIYAAADARSSVSAGNRLATCRQCHADARGFFADYRPHADPVSPRSSPGLFAVWLAMTVLLGAVTLVYLAHAVLVSRRTLIERRRPR
jgi:hypothetical protein